jgi:hypothetical protein
MIVTVAADPEQDSPNRNRRAGRSDHVGSWDPMFTRRVQEP